MIHKLKQDFKGGKFFLAFSFIKIVAQGLFALMPLIVAKFLHPEGFGSYSLSLMVVLFFVSLFINASQTPFVVHAGEEQKDQGKINKSFSAQLLILLVSVILFFAITLIFKNSLIAFAEISAMEFYFLFFAFLGISFKTFILNLFLALNKRLSNAIYELFYGFFCVALIVIFVALDMVNLQNIFLIYLIAAVLAVLPVMVKLDFKKLIPFDLKISHFKKMFRFMLWQMFGLTAVYFINWGDNLALRTFVSMDEIGVYNLGYQIFNGIIALTFILDSYFLPFLSRNIGNKKELQDYLYKKRPKAFLLGVVGCLVVFLIIPYIFNLVYGPDFAGSVMVIKILLMANLFAIYTIFYIPLFNSLKKYKFIQVLNIFQVLLNLALSFLMVYLWGYLGAAIATLIAYGFGLIVFEIYYHLKIKPSYIFVPEKE